MSFGVTPTGFNRPSADEIRAEVVQRARDIYGPINTGPESGIGQQIAAQVERESLIWSAMEAVYLSQYPDSAAGRSLDGAVQLTGVTRLGATRTIVLVELEGTPGTVIPEGSQMSTGDGDVFELVNQQTLDGTGQASGQARALEAGPVLALAGTLVNIDTPVSGWDSVNNPDDGETGRAVETDPELRSRRLQSLSVTGAGTVEAIRARLLQQVEDVTAVTIIENRSDDVDADGRPPHSFEAVVSGGVDEDVANLIWLAKPAGIETHGDITVIVTDSQGEPQPISFSRPVLVYIWVRVTITPNGVGSWPGDANATEAATDAIVEAGSQLGVGDNVIFQSLFGPVYDAVPGIESLSIELAATSEPGTPPSSYAAENLTIGANELAAFLDDRVEVIIDG